MANYYIRFSVLFKLHSDEEREWAQTELDRLRGEQQEYLDILEDGEPECDEPFNILASITPSGDLWFRDNDGHGDPECAGYLILELLNKFRPDARPFFFEWALTCSSARTDGFGGGITIIRPGEEGVRSYVTSELAVKLIDEEEE